MTECKLCCYPFSTIRIQTLTLPQLSFCHQSHWIPFCKRSIVTLNGMVLRESEDIKKRWQEYTEELYKKDLHDPDNHNGVITQLEPDILECEVSGP